MTADNGTSKRRTGANFAFGAFVFAVFSWALLETELFIMAATVRVHMVASAYGLLISALALRRCRLSWALFADDSAVNRSGTDLFQIGAVTSSVALLATGCALALSAKAGSVTFFVVCAGAFSFVPWSRIGFCRRNFFISCTMLGAGAASVLAATGLPHPILTLLYAWVLSSIAVSELLVTLRWNQPATAPPEKLEVLEPQSSVAGRNTLKTAMEQTGGG